MCAEPDCNEPMHHWFGLSYSSYLVLNRSVIQDMPVEWQRRLVALLDEVDERVDTRAFPPSFRVLALGERGRFVTDPFRDYRHPQPIPLRHPEKESRRG